MKTVLVGWTETDLILYGYEEEFEVADNFEITKENCLSLVKNWRETDSRSFYSKFTDYDDADQELYPVKVDDVVEILPPSPEEKKAEYYQMLIDLQKEEDAIKAEKESIIKLMTKEL